MQIRTRAQSAWANTYERIGDLAGRHIRYGEPHEVPEVQSLVDRMHAMSAFLAKMEDEYQNARQAKERLRRLQERIEERGGVDGFLDGQRFDEEDRAHVREVIAELPERQAELHQMERDYRAMMNSQLAVLEDIEQVLTTGRTTPQPGRTVDEGG
ncbi:hypothetical protein [Gordonia sp. NPDC003585]|uniref:hypothetical protein n=1 Tax=Gordonia sp. NPDC003585 TaxID=3154275 RepID=UPI0033AD093F